MTKYEMDAAVNIMKLMWDSAYTCGMLGLLKSDKSDCNDPWKENHDHRDEHIVKLIEAAGLEVDTNSRRNMTKLEMETIKEAMMKVVYEAYFDPDEWQKVIEGEINEEYWSKRIDDIIEYFDFKVD